jgi:hypothetical protein
VESPNKDFAELGACAPKPLNPKDAVVNSNRSRGVGCMRIVLTLGVIICMAFPAVALGQSSGENSGEKYVGQKTGNQFSCETPGPLSCPYPPSPPLMAEGAPMSDNLVGYQANFRDPDEYYHAGKSPAPPAAQKGE